MVKVVKLDEKIIKISLISTHPTLLIVKLPFKHMVYKQFATLFKSFGEILPNFTKSYQVSQHNKYILLQLGNFYRNFNKKVTTYCGINLYTPFTGHFRIFLGTKL